MGGWNKVTEKLFRSVFSVYVRKHCCSGPIDFFHVSFALLFYLWVEGGKGKKVTFTMCKRLECFAEEKERGGDRYFQG